RPEIYEVKVQNFSIIEIALWSDRLTEHELVERTRRLKKILQQLESVNSVETGGVSDREIQIKVNLDKMKEREISFVEISRILQSRNLNLSGGSLQSYLAEKEIITVARFTTLDDVKNVILRSNPDGKRVLLGDIALVTDSFEKKSSMIRYNGHNGLSLSVIKKENADIIAAVKEIKKAIEKFRTTPAARGINFEFLNDMSEQTASMLSIVINNAVIGLALVMLVLFLFLNFKTALWTAAGLPVSIFMTLALMKLAGVTINVISLCGIIIVLGMLVDDSIIIAENTYRHRLAGLSWKDSALLGVHEIYQPVISTIATTIIAFIPIMFMEGMVGDFSREIPVVIGFTLTASLFEAFFILPEHLAYTKKTRGIDQNTPVKIHDKKLFVWLEKNYRPLLQKALHNKNKMIAIFVIILAASVFHAAVNMKFIMFDEDQAWFFWIEGHSKSGSSMEKTADDLRVIEKILSDYPKSVIKSHKTQIGLNIWGGSADPDFFTVMVYMSPVNERRISCRAAVEEIKSRIKKSAPDFNCQIFIDNGGPPAGRPLEIELTGNNDAERLAAAEYLKNYLSQIEGVYDIIDNHETGKDEIRINIDYDLAARYGMSAADIARTIRTAYNGTVVTYQQTPEERIAYRLMLDDSYRKTSATLDELAIISQYGKLVPVKHFLKKTESRSVKRIHHFNADRTINISANIDNKKTTPAALYKKINSDLPDIREKFGSLRFLIRGETQESMKTMKSFAAAMIIAVIAIYFLLVLQFNSFLQPLLILVTIPFGMIGVIIAFSLHGLAFTMMALLGILGLSGVVVNDSIVMVDFINSQAKMNPEKPLIDLIVEGAVSRLRPILMTSITTVAGLLPTAYGIGGYDYMIAPMVLALAWGLFFATALTLFLVPALYLSQFRKIPV
ncbi:MAG TPA: hypothetical protein DC049_14975, partial [Spirochaetia bacterium]|nr:hypothetical protein [Spirochaetia bacterium]